MHCFFVLIEIVQYEFTILHNSINSMHIVLSRCSMLDGKGWELALTWPGNHPQKTRESPLAKSGGMLCSMTGVQISSDVKS